MGNSGAAIGAKDPSEEVVAAKFGCCPKIGWGTARSAGALYAARDSNPGSGDHRGVGACERKFADVASVLESAV
jgi:hypothetical protein